MIARRAPMVFAAVLLLIGLCSACVTAVSLPSGGASADEHEEEVELAALMTPLQSYAHKLGLAMKAENNRLADFYLHEVEELLEEIEDVETYEGMPVGRPTSVIMFPLVADLKSALSKGEWETSMLRYKDLLTGCNRCHTALEHEYIQIVPQLDQNPYMQDFRPNGG